MSRPSLVIIGAGWGGFPISQQINLDRYSVKVISPIRTIQYTPLLASAACGLFDFRMAEEPVRRRHRAGMEYYKAGAESIDLDRRVVLCRPDVGHMTVEGNKRFEVGYDVLVLAMGCVGTQTFGTPGAQEHALFLRTTNDARILQQRILQMLDAASLPGVAEQQQRDLCHIRVVGGGAVGIEAVAELFDLYDEGLRFVYPHLDGKVSFTIHDVADSVLSTFDEGLGQYAMQSLRAKNVEVKTSNHIEKVEQDAIHTKEDGRLPYGLLLWATGNSASPLTEALDVKKSKGVPRILTDKHLRVLKTDGTAYDNVFALGDAADIESQSLPMLAEVALQKGEYLTHRLNAQPPTTTDISHVQPFEYKQRAILAYLGQRDGIVGGRSEWKGNSAWLAWRSGSLGWTRSWRRKIAILAQWGLIWWNGRDIARL